MKLAVFHPAASAALRGFPKPIRRAIGKAIQTLQEGHALAMPLSRKMPSIGPGVSEIRVKDGERAFRTVYLVPGEVVLVAHVFVKKTEETSPRDIKIAKARIKEMLR